jgi:hypothetical protein
MLDLRKFIGQRTRVTLRSGIEVIGTVKQYHSNKAWSTEPDPQDIVAVQAVTALGNEPFDHVVDRLLLHSADAP